MSESPSSVEVCLDKLRALHTEAQEARICQLMAGLNAQHALCRECADMLRQAAEIMDKAIQDDRIDKDKLSTDELRCPHERTKAQPAAIALTEVTP